MEPENLAITIERQAIYITELEKQVKGLGVALKVANFALCPPDIQKEIIKEGLLEFKGE